MSESPFQRLGPLYAKVGLQTAPEIVAARISGAETAHLRFNEFGIEHLIRGTFGLTTPSELEALAKILGETDPTFSPESDDSELALIAGGLLHRKIEEGGQAGVDVAMTVVTASFGSVRQSKFDPSLLALAVEHLASAQHSSNQFPSDATFKPKPKKVAWEKLDEHAEANQYNNVHPELKTIVEQSFTYAEGAVKDVARQLNAIISHQRLLDEQMQVHWWIVGGQSLLEQKPFSQLSTLDAASCAALELAQLSKSRNGLFSSNVLLSRMIDYDHSDKTTFNISDCVKAIPLERRASETADLLSDEDYASLLPLHLAMALSADANDANDWHGRFKRSTNIAATKKISPLDFASQLYQEVLTRRLNAN